ncbi:MAG TPA: hypothetical protein VGT44_20625 [Ktedonobacteraceae bacterium]|nr:hypothetical protein [Ktedonobacteraceae bacterium]
MRHSLRSDTKEWDKHTRFWLMIIITLLSSLLIAACDTPGINGNGSNNGVGNGNAGNCNGNNVCNTTNNANSSATPGTPSGVLVSSPTPTPTLEPCPSLLSPSSGVTAIVKGGCQYSITWVFGFKSSNAPGETGINAAGFLNYGSTGNSGGLSNLGIHAGVAYPGGPPTLYAWLVGLGGGCAIVISDSNIQPSAGQLGGAEETSGYVGYPGGPYLPDTYVLAHTTPQPGGGDYQFNLVVAT